MVLLSDLGQVDGMSVIAVLGPWGLGQAAACFAFGTRKPDDLVLAIFQQFAQRQRVFPLVSVHPDELLGRHGFLEEFNGLCSGFLP